MKPFSAPNSRHNCTDSISFCHAFNSCWLFQCVHMYECSYLQVHSAFASFLIFLKHYFLPASSTEGLARTLSFLTSKTRQTLSTSCCYLFVQEEEKGSLVWSRPKLIQMQNRHLFVDSNYSYLAAHLFISVTGNSTWCIKASLTKWKIRFRNCEDKSHGSTFGLKWVWWELHLNSKT